MKNHIKEIWKIIPNSIYAISNIGRIKRIKHQRFHNINKIYYTAKEKILIPSNNNSKKYWRIRIYYLDNTKRTESIHRLVAKAFISNPLGKLQVNHKDGNKNNNNYTNLEWATNDENMYHRYTTLKIFNQLKGSKSHLSKLKEDQVYNIAKKIKKGERLIDIARIYKVGITTISEIKAGRSWTHLELFPYKKAKCKKYDKAQLGLRYSPTTTEK